MVLLKEEARQVALNLGPGFLSIWTCKERSLNSSSLPCFFKATFEIRGETGSFILLHQRFPFRHFLGSQILLRNCDSDISYLVFNM